MKKRLVKKMIKKLSDKELFKQVVYNENKRFSGILEKEFHRRFGNTLKQEEEISESLAGVSYETDELVKIK